MPVGAHPRSTANFKNSVSRCRNEPWLGISAAYAAGVILADVWVGKRIVVIDQLGKEFLDGVEQGQEIEVFEDGHIEIKMMVW